MIIESLFYIIDEMQRKFDTAHKLLWSYISKGPKNARFISQKMFLKCILKKYFTEIFLWNKIIA